MERCDGDRPRGFGKGYTARHTEIIYTERLCPLCDALETIDELRGQTEELGAELRLAQARADELSA
jgi:hypothetical protein